MRSALPKVLQPLGDRPLLAHVARTALALAPERVHVVYGHGGAQVRERLAWLDVNWVEQSEQLGTGHAVQQAMPDIPDAACVLVLYGDVPLTRTQTLQRLVNAADAGLALLTVNLANPSGYGRILRHADGSVQGIVEQKDASAAQLAIDEVNTGLMAANAAAMRRWLGNLSCDNAQAEYYLTDVVAMAVAEGTAVACEQPEDADEVSGVNDRAQLAALERVFQCQQAQSLLRAGLHLRDPQRFDLRGQLQFGRDVSIDVGAVLEGDVQLGEGVSIGPYCCIKNSRIAAGSQILAHSVIEDAEIAAGCHIGPFARLRPGAQLDDGARVGNFVEIKKSHIGKGSKVNHLSYVGDAEIGERVNIGAGVITCNYDGVHKHQTVIGDDAFIGSDCQLVAPVTIGAGATIGAGSTITRDAPAQQLSLSRSKQKSLASWQRPAKDRQR